MSVPASIPSSLSTGPDALSIRETDASCRAPLAVLIPGAAFWLVIAAALGLLASIQFHSPDFLSGAGWLTYGRVRAAAAAAQMYGFALPAGFTVILWILARAGRNRVSQPWLIAIGGKLWHLGVLVGVVGILAGDGTGFEALEMPRYAAVILVLGYLTFGIWAALTLRDRRETRLAPSQWFLLAALLWFPWIYSTANLLLLVFPVRGVMQSVIGWWYADNLRFVWLGLVGLAALFHLTPEFTERPLHSEYLALFTFWTLILFGSWSGIPADAPIPAWMPAISRIATVATLVVFVSVAVNLWPTQGGARPERPPDVASWFLCFGMVLFLLFGAMKIVGALPDAASLLRFTWFTVAESQVMNYGFFAMTMFGALYCLVPRVAGMEFPWARAVRWHFWLSALGVLLLAVPLAAGGVVQGFKLRNPDVDGVTLARAMLPFLRVSTLGDTLILAGSLVWVVNLSGLVARLCRVHLLPLYETATTKLDPSEVKA